MAHLSIVIAAIFFVSATVEYVSSDRTNVLLLVPASLAIVSFFVFRTRLHRL
jgi:hypothetical protein